MQGFKPCFVDLFLLLQVYLFSRGSYLYIIYGLVDRFPHDVLMYWLHYALQTYIIHLLIHTYRTRPATTTSLLVQYNRKGRCNKRKQEWKKEKQKCRRNQPIIQTQSDDDDAQGNKNNRNSLRSWWRASKNMV